MSNNSEQWISVPKKWGQELWMVNSSLYCSKMMTLEPGYMCSLHRHLKKTETFSVLEGKMLLHVDGSWIALQRGQSYTIRARQWHHFTGIGSRPCVFIETSTTHSDEDVERMSESRWLDHHQYDKLLEKFNQLVLKGSGGDCNPSSA